MEVTIDSKNMKKLFKEHLPHTTIKSWEQDKKDKKEFKVIVNVDSNKLRKEMAGKNAIYRPENNNPEYVLRKDKGEMVMFLQ